MMPLVYSRKVKTIKIEKKKDKLLPRVVMVKMKRQSTGERQWKNCGGLVEATNHYIFVPLSV